MSIIYSLNTIVCVVLFIIGYRKNKINYITVSFILTAIRNSLRLYDFENTREILEE